jgi:two-component system, OmpR family, sensor histidine kinase CreC
VTWLIALCVAADAGLLIFVIVRVYRSRQDGASLRLRIFGALAAATLAGALLTGTYTVAEEALRTGVRPVAARIAPKAFVVGSALLMLSAAGAAAVGRGLARSVEELTEAATRIAEGELKAPLPRGSGKEARRLARALASMRRELEGRPYAAAFLRDAWHDLKTPAAAIKATVEVLADGAIDDRDASRKFLENLRRSTDQLERTLADLVTLARFETATLAPEQLVSVGSLALVAVEAVRPLAEAKGVRLEARPAEPAGPPLGETARLRCDPAALSRALGNLLENAIDATSAPGGSVEITVADGPGGSIIEVTNEPSQVPAELRSRLFERSATSRKGVGSGLGLAIARAAVEAHGGRVRFVELGPPRVRVKVELPR